MLVFLKLTSTHVNIFFFFYILDLFCTATSTYIAVQPAFERNNIVRTEVGPVLILKQKLPLTKVTPMKVSLPGDIDIPSSKGNASVPNG